MTAECNVVKKNLGLSRCNKLPAMPRCMISTPAGFYFTPAQIADEDAFQTALEAALLAGIATRIYLWPLFKGFENVSEEAIYENTPLATLRVRDGQYRFRAMISENLCLHKAMYTHRANSGRVFIYDLENQLLGTEDADGNFMGFTITLLNTEKFMISDGSVSTKSPIYICLADNKELDRDGVILDSDIAHVINTVNRLADINLTIVSATTTVITVDVKQSCDGTGIEGLLTADFLLTDNDNGASHAVTAAPHATIAGRYTLTGVAYEASSLTLRPPSTLTAKNYEVEAAVAVTPV